MNKKELLQNLAPPQYIPVLIQIPVLYIVKRRCFATALFYSFTPPSVTPAMMYLERKR